MTMKTIGPSKAACWIRLGDEKFETELLLIGERLQPSRGSIVFEGDPAQLRKRKTATGRALGKIAAALACAAE